MEMVMIGLLAFLGVPAGIIIATLAHDFPRFGLPRLVHLALSAIAGVALLLIPHELTASAVLALMVVLGASLHAPGRDISSYLSALTVHLPVLLIPLLSIPAR